MNELYKRHRPKTLEKVVGNPETCQALSQMLTNHRLPHTILFHGPSGCGKTTLARIVVRALGCHELDFKEVNSSSFRGIDTIREIQRSMNLSPAAGPVRVWHLDEVHKLSNDAQNAALKILEDTPNHVYFLLSTTDPQKLIKAILTRCCEMPVRLLTYDELGTLCTLVCKKEGLTLSNDVKDELIASAQGSARTLLVLLDKIANLDADQQATAIQTKLAEENEAIDLCRSLIKKDSWKKVTGILKNLKGDPEQTRWAVLGYARVVLLKEVNHQAYLVIECFKNHFYDSKEAGLASACFEAIHAKG